MPDPRSSDDKLSQLLQHTVVLALEDVATTLVDRDKFVARALKDPKIKEAIDAELLQLDAGVRLHRAQHRSAKSDGRPITPDAHAETSLVSRA